MAVPSISIFHELAAHYSQNYSAGWLNVVCMCIEYVQWYVAGFEKTKCNSAKKFHDKA